MAPLNSIWHVMGVPAGSSNVPTSTPSPWVCCRHRTLAALASATAVRAGRWNGHVWSREPHLQTVGDDRHRQQWRLTGRPNRGDSITFAISTTQTWSQLSLVCSQNGAVVLPVRRTPNAWSPITLSSQTWQTDAADCVATLDQVNDTRALTLAAAAFTVAS